MLDDKDKLLNFREARRLHREELLRQQIEEVERSSLLLSDRNWKVAELREKELRYQQWWQEMTEQERMERDIFYAAEEGNLEVIQCIVSQGVRVSVTDYVDCGIMTTAARGGYANIVKYVLENSKNSEYCENCLEDTFECAILGGNLEIVKMLLNRGITSEHGIYEAIDRKQEQIAVYLVEHNNGVFNLYDRRRGSNPSILELAVCEGMPLTVGCIIKKHPEMLPILPKLAQDVLLPGWVNVGVIKVLKKHLGCLDVNDVPLDKFDYEYHKTKSVLYALIFHYESQDLCRLYRDVKFLVAYGASVDEYERIWSDLLEPVPPRDTYHGIMDYAEVVELYQNRQIYAEIFDEAVREGREIWRWNQQMMREVMKWSACVVWGGGGSGGDVAGDMKRTNSTGMGSVVGLGKRAVEALVKFAPAQFDEKLELGTVRVLRAQAMLAAGHGVAFGNVHHGGDVKYKGDAIVSCNYHAEVRMKNAGKIVHVGGDSYVDEPLWRWQRLTHQHVTQPLTQHTTQDDVAHVWDNDAYDQKLQAQQQWYTETGEVLPTFAVMTRSHHDTITVLDSPCQLQHSVHVRSKAIQQDIPQVVPQLTHTSPQHHLQLHISHDELQQGASEPHIADFLHSISML